MSERLNNMLEPVSQDHSLAGLLKRPEYSRRFEAVLGERAPQFASSLISIGNSLGKDVNPKSIIGSAMIAAALDLPIDKNLGFAWIVPYKGEASFQMGYKGYIQLGMRSAQYKRMNATGINQEVFKGWDSVGEPILDWDKYDPEKPIWGYFFGFELVNGFTKVAVWSKEKVHAHAQKYSQSYRAGKDIWKLQFDGMALKTVIANTLRKWGPMSVQLQRALQADSAIIKDIDAEPVYPDQLEAGTTTPVFEHPAKKEQETEQKQVEAPAPQPVKRGPGRPPKTETQPAAGAPAPKVMPAPEPAPVPAPEGQPEQPPAQETTLAMPDTEPALPLTEPEEVKLSLQQQQLADALSALNHSFQDFVTWGTGAIPFIKAKAPKSWSDIPDDKALFFINNIKGVDAGIKKIKAGAQ